MPIANRCSAVAARVQRHPRRAAARLACAVAAIAVLCAGTARPSAALEAPRLRALLGQARLAVRAEVTEVVPYDHGRIAVAHLRVVKTLKGTASESVLVVESRDLPTPPIFVSGQHVVVFLKMAPRTSQLATVVPEGQYYALVDPHTACLASTAAADADEAAAIVAQLAGASRKPDTNQARRVSSRRQLIFDLVAARLPPLVEDGANSLREIANLTATLTSDEQGRLETALGRADLPLPVRIALIHAVAAAKLQQLVPTLRALRDPDLLEASWAALAQLDAAPKPEDLRDQLGSPEPKVRAAAAKQLLNEEGAAAIPFVQRIAVSDPDKTTQLAAIEALGDTKSPAALPALEQVFSVTSWDARQASARAINTIGGREASEAYARLAFSAPPEAQIYAVTLLKVTGVGDDDILIKRIRETHPNPEVREVAEHGLPYHKH